jgi:biopolymer transport protein TolR
MLVLLIVFMISAPLMQQGLQVDLPKANAEAIHETQEQLVLVIDKNRRIFIADIAIEHGTLAKKIDAIVRAKPSTEIVIQADQAIPYGFVAQVMSTVKQAGIHRVGLAMNPGDPKGLL